MSLSPAKRDHLPAGRIALGVAVPLILLHLAGRIDLAIFAAFASFSGIYARHEPFRSRVTHQVAAAIILLVCEALGLWLGHTHASEWTVVVAATLVAGIGAWLAAVLSLRPGGSLFFVFAMTAIAGVSNPAPAGQALSVAGATALFCVVLGLLGAQLSQRIRPDELMPPPPHGLTRQQLTWHVLRHFVAALLAGVLGVLSGFGHSYWAMVAALAPMTGATRRLQLERGVHRIVGTLGGIGVSVFLLAFTFSSWFKVLLVVLMQFLAEMFVARNYSIALLFVTPLALLMTQLAATSDPWTLVTSRTVETVIGALAGLVVAWLLRSDEERRLDREAQVRAAAEEPA